MSTPPRVVVVGAGLAGLSCAVELSDNGIDCAVVEASDGVGGRVRTDLADASINGAMASGRAVAEAVLQDLGRS